MHHSEVKGAKVLVEGHVGEVGVNVEEEGVLDVCGGLSVSDPVELAGNNFYLTTELLIVALQGAAAIVEGRLSRIRRWGVGLVIFAKSRLFHGRTQIRVLTERGSLTVLLVLVKQLVSS